MSLVLLATIRDRSLSRTLSVKFLQLPAVELAEELTIRAYPELVPKDCKISIYHREVHGDICAPRDIHIPFLNCPCLHIQSPFTRMREQRAVVVFFHQGICVSMPSVGCSKRFASSVRLFRVVRARDYQTSELCKPSLQPAFIVYLWVWN